jgi:hypothetical protein
VNKKLRSLSDILEGLPAESSPVVPERKLESNKPTAILLVESYNGLGIHSLLNIVKQFPGYFKQMVFVSVAVLDTGNFKGSGEVERLEENTKRELDHYVKLATNLGIPSHDFKQSVFFAAKLVFQKQKWYQRILHSETAYAIQNRLQFQGLSMVVLPVRVWN